MNDLTYKQRDGSTVQHWTCSDFRRELHLALASNGVGGGSMAENTAENERETLVEI